MPPTANEERIFAALIEEAKALRAENIIAITNVRRTALAAMYIAGFGVPLIGGILQLNKPSQSANAAPPELLELIKQNPEPIVCIGLGVSLTCLAALSIYLGSFRQIFNYARYFRDVLIPSINALAGKPQPDLPGKSG